jgi:hypothetical protein
VWIGRGLDYTDPAFAQRLARDGEGEIIGYDMIDDDRRPHAGPHEPEAGAASLLLAGGQSAALIVIRADTASIDSLVAAIGYGARTPSRIAVILDAGTSADFDVVVQAAARRFPQSLFLIAARPVATLFPGNVLTVAAEGAADAVGDVTAPPGEHELAAAAPTGQRALARVAALAVRLRAIEPGLDGASMRARIVALAEPAENGRAPHIANPKRHFWLE